MIDITFVLIGIIVLFAIFIALRSILSLKICALCSSVSLTWIVLFVLLFVGYEVNPVLIGLLVGGSIVGVMYVLEQKLPEEYQLFKLPFFLTLVSVAYFVIELSVITNTVVIVVVLWLFTILIHASRNIKSLKSLGKKIIECCKNW